MCIMIKTIVKNRIHLFVLVHCRGDIIGNGLVVIVLLGHGQCGENVGCAGGQSPHVDCIDIGIGMLGKTFIVTRMAI